MLINHNIYPKHLGDSFIKEYKNIRNRRVIAKKKSKDKNIPEEDRIRYKHLNLY
jgi:hypothetical protein